MNLILLQIWRPIQQTVEKYFQKTPNKTISYGDIQIDDYPKIIKEFYNSLSQTEENYIVLSGPVSLNFAIWQLVWINHFPIKLFQWNSEKLSYEELPSINRNILL